MLEKPASLWSSEISPHIKNLLNDHRSGYFEVRNLYKNGQLGVGSIIFILDISEFATRLVTKMISDKKYFAARYKVINGKLHVKKAHGARKKGPNASKLGDGFLHRGDHGFGAKPRHRRTGKELEIARREAENNPVEKPPVMWIPTKPIAHNITITPLHYTNVQSQDILESASMLARKFASERRVENCKKRYEDRYGVGAVKQPRRGKGYAQGNVPSEKVTWIWSFKNESLGLQYINIFFLRRQELTHKHEVNPDTSTCRLCGDLIEEGEESSENEVEYGAIPRLFFVKKYNLNYTSCCLLASGKINFHRGWTRVSEPKHVLRSEILNYWAVRQEDAYSLRDGEPINKQKAGD
jgi:hypothetical protein